MTMMRIAFAVVLLLAACNAKRVPGERLQGPADLPNLRRASDALKQRVAREKEHVDALQDELVSLRAGETRLYADVLEAEDDYQRLRSDADGSFADLRAVERELAELAVQLELGRAELGTAQDEMNRLDAQLATARFDGMLARRGLEFWRGGLNEDETVSLRRQTELDQFRQTWTIPRPVWDKLLIDLGLPWLRLGAAPERASRNLTGELTGAAAGALEDDPAAASTATEETTTDTQAEDADSAPEPADKGPP
jgi:hypothetical protein